MVVRSCPCLPNVGSVHLSLAFFVPIILPYYPCVSGICCALSDHEKETHLYPPLLTNNANDSQDISNLFWMYHCPDIIASTFYGINSCTQYGWGVANHPLASFASKGNDKDRFESDVNHLVKNSVTK